MSKLTVHYKRVIAFISDLHVGSSYGLFPKGIETPQGNEIKLNKGQEKLLEYWNEFWSKADRWDVDTVIDCGDSCSGLNRKEFGVNLMASDLEVQKDAYVSLIKPHVKGRQYINITGSGYHQSLDTKIQKDIAKRLGGKFYGAIANIHPVKTSRIINISHGVGGAFVYRSTALDREGLFQLASTALGKIPKVDIVVRGHLHSFIHLHMPSQHLIQLPCWVAYEPNKIMLKSYGKLQPDIGAVILFIDEEDRVDIHHYLYPLIHIDDFVREC